MDPYRYQRLDHDRPTFRLLRLHQGNRGELTCNIFEALLHHDNLIQYEALSYTWGAPATPRSITVDGQQLAITQSLYQALISLRHPHTDRILWIDAICIDQASKKERSHQVAQMSEIYQQADCVIFFLGRATYQTDALMEYMCHIQEERNKHAYRSWARDDKRWRSIQEVAEANIEKPDKEMLSFGLRSLLDRSWFLRVWILQEVANAKNAIVSCGKKEIAASVFGIAPILLDVSPTLHCQSVIDIMPGPWRKTSWWSKSPCLYTLLLRFGNTQATESRDLIYALRGIATEKESFILTPDYDKSEECLVRDIIQFLFNFRYNASMPWSMPSTIRDVIRNLVKIKDKIFLERIRAGEATLLESLIQAPGFTPSPSIVEDAMQYDRTGQTMKLLLKHRLRGWRIDTWTLLTAMEKGAIPVVSVLEHHLGTEAPATVEDMLVAAANNQCHGSDMMNYVLPRSRDLGDYTWVAEVAASNVTQAVRIIRQLVDRGSRITVTPQLLKNAFESGCYEDVLGMFMHCSRTGFLMRDEAAGVDAVERETAVASARTIFRGIAKFLISHATYDDSIYDTLRQSGRRIEAHGYKFLEQLILCAVEVFRDEGSSRSKLRDQFFNRTGTLNWVADESGFDFWITRDIVKASIEGQFFDWIRSFWDLKGDSLRVDPDAAAEIFTICCQSNYCCPTVVTEHILQYRGGQLRHDKVVLGALREVYCVPEGRGLDYWLHVACSGNRLETLKLLLSWAGDTERRNHLGDTVLTTACIGGGGCGVQALLLSKGANPNTHTHRDTSLLSAAVMRMDHGLVELLLVCGANPNMADRGSCQGQTPLMAAVSLDDAGLVELLLRYGADPAARSLQGQSAECLARSEAVVLLLRKYSPRRLTRIISISPRVQRIIKAFRLVSKPYERSLGVGLLRDVRGLARRLHMRWRRKRWQNGND